MNIIYIHEYPHYTHTFISNCVPVGVFESIDGLLEAEHAGTDIDDHNGLAVAAQAVFEHACELGVPVVHERALFYAHYLLGLVAERVDAVGQRQQRAVDLGPLEQPHPLVPSQIALH